MENKSADYSEIRHLLKSFDLIAFRGSEIVSDTISEIETLENGKYMGKYTHVGIIMLGDSFPETSKLYDPGVVYIFEATMSGKLNGGVLNVDGRQFLGVQLRDFDKVVESIDANKHAYMAWCKLKDEYIPTITSEQYLELFNKYNETRFDVNFVDLFASAFKCVRRFREICTHCHRKHQKPWMFCSELVANIYKDLNILPNEIDARNVIPCDLIYHTNNMPAILEDPILFT